MLQIDIFHQIVNAVQHLHDHNVVHRDMKPSNVVHFPEKFAWKLIDLATIAQAGEVAKIVSFKTGYQQLLTWILHLGYLKVHQMPLCAGHKRAWLICMWFHFNSGSAGQLTFCRAFVEYQPIAGHPVRLVRCRQSSKPITDVVNSLGMPAVGLDCCSSL